MNAVMLLKKVGSSGLTLTQVSKRLGLSRQSLYLKLKGKREFRAGEIKDIKDLLSLEPQELNDIFFEGDAYAD